MLSAFAARRNQLPAVAVDDTREPLQTDSDMEEPSIQRVAKAPIKRKADMGDYSLSSRKRKKGAYKEARYFERVPVGSVPEISVTPRREYSPSMPVIGDSNLTHATDDAAPLLSTFQPVPNKNVFIEGENSSSLRLYLVLNPGETLSFIGTIALTVIQGSVSLFGSLLEASPNSHAIYAPKTYPTATIEALESMPTIISGLSLPPVIPALIEPHQVVILLKDLSSGVQGLGRICGFLQGAFEVPHEYEFNFRLREFHPLIRYNAIYTPFQLPTSWRDALEEVQNASSCPISLVKGPKNSGKSMFARLLINSLLQRYKLVAYLDCDVGQTEFTPAGIVSLHLLSEPLFGPPFTHPHSPVSAHFTGSTSIRSNPRHYHECVSALLDTYRSSIKYGFDELLAESLDLCPRDINTEEVPLVINTFGWNKGAGGDALVQIESQGEVTHVYSLEPASSDSTWAQNDAPRSQDAQYVSLEAIVPPRIEQSNSDKRALMTMSYFHYHESGCTPTQERWRTDLPLCAMPPWEVAWADALERIVLIGNGAEDVHRSELLRALNGAIVALVGLDSYIPGWSQSKTTGNLPYIEGADPPPPYHSHCIGFALVRSVRASTGTLHLVTPVPPERLMQTKVLVMGEIQLPIWGMLDHRPESQSTGQIAGVEYTSVPFLQWNSGTSDAQGAKRLRVRRNLMRKAQL